MDRFTLQAPIHLKSGRWMVRVWDTLTHKVHTSASAKTRKEAVARAEEKADELNGNSSGDMILEEAAKLWLQTRNASPSTLYNYNSTVTNLLKKFPKNQSVRGLLASQIRAANLTPDQLLKLKSILLLMVQDKVISTSPAQGIKVGKRKPNKSINVVASKPILLRQASEKLCNQCMTATTPIKAIHAQRNLLLFTLLLHSGMRISEALGLTYADLNRNVISLEFQLDRNQSTISNPIRKAPKADSERKIPIALPIYRAITAHRQLIQSAGYQCNEGDFIFRHYTKSRVNHMEKSGTRKIIENTVGDLGLTAHSLRHLSNFFMDRAGASTRTRADILGHEGIADTITDSIYLTSTMEDKWQCMNGQAKILISILGMNLAPLNATHVNQLIDGDMESLLAKNTPLNMTIQNPVKYDIGWEWDDDL